MKKQSAMGLIVVLTLLLAGTVFVRGHQALLDTEVTTVELSGDQETEAPELPTPASTPVDDTMVQGSGRLVTEGRPVDSMYGVVLAGPGELVITQGDRESLTVATDDNIIPLIQPQLKDGILYLGLFKENQQVWPTKLTYYLSVDELTDLQLMGAGNILVNGLESERVELAHRGTGDIVIESLSTWRLTVIHTGSGDLELSGRVERQDLSLSGTGDYYAANLASNEITISMSGNGDATLQVHELLVGQIYGSGDLEYYGTPSVSVDTIGLGELVGLDQASHAPTATPTKRAANVGTISGSGISHTEAREASNFDRITFAATGRVLITQSEKESVTVTADENLMPFIRTHVEDNTLILSFSDELGDQQIQPKIPIQFQVNVRQLVGLNIHSDGSFHVSTLDTDRLEIRIDGAGEINISSLAVPTLTMHLDGEVSVWLGSLTADRLSVNLDGVGDVVTAGEVGSLQLFLNGQGNFDGQHLASQTTVVEASGIGHAILWVTDILDAHITGPSTVEFYGSPQVSKEVNRMGRLVWRGMP